MSSNAEELSEVNGAKEKASKGLQWFPLFWFPSDFNFSLSSDTS
jgi:hypothetical protein